MASYLIFLTRLLAFLFLPRYLVDNFQNMDPEAVDEICPAPISGDLAARIADLGVRAHRALGCRHYSRTDVMLDGDGEPVVLETNTLPGLTPASLFPKAAAAAGMSFDALIGRLVDLAAGRR